MSIVMDMGEGVSTQVCTTVSVSPNSGSTPLTVVLSTTTSTAHIFYTKKSGSTGVNPTHTGDSATGTTLRIGSNSGSVSIGAGFWVVRALAYAPGFLDSAITEGDYEPPT